MQLLPLPLLSSNGLRAPICLDKCVSPSFAALTVLKQDTLGCSVALLDSTFKFYGC